MNLRNKAIQLLFVSLAFLLPGRADLPAQTIFDTSKVHELVLEIDLAGWADTLMRYKKTYSKRRIGGNLILDGKQYDPVGIRYKGHSSFFNFAREEKTKLPFNVNMKYFVKGQTLDGEISKLKLSNNYRDLSYIREMLTRHIAGHYVHLPRMSFAGVYANDEYLGLYSMIEGLEGPFLKRSFQKKKGTLVKCDPVWKAPSVKGCPESDNASLEYLGENIACYTKWYDLKSKRGWTSLIRLTRILEQQPDSIEAVLDVYSALWMLALNNTLVNLDSYTGALGHNYYLFQPEGGVFVPLMWDMNLSFGGFAFTRQHEKLKPAELITLDPLLHAHPPFEKRPLIASLLARPLYRKVYISMIKTILDDFFISKQYIQVANRFHQMIAPHVASENERIYPLADFKASLDATLNIRGGKLIGICELMESRTKFLVRHPELQYDSPVYRSHLVLERGSMLQVNLRTENTDRAWLYIRTGKEYVFRKVEMNMLEQGRWQVSIDADIDDRKCFFVLENEEAAAIWPDRAPKEFFRLSGE